MDGNAIFGSSASAGHKVVLQSVVSCRGGGVRWGFTSA
jgi:hypothetical protein